MTINPEIFWSVLTALFAYGISKHVLGVVLGRLWTVQPKAAINPRTGRSGENKSSAV